MATKAAIYARISSDREGRELGVERQIEDCRKLAERLGMDVVRVYTENDTGASTRSQKARPLFKEMIERARLGEYGAILAYSNSRLTRRPRENEDLIELAEKHQLRISTVASGEYDLNRADGRAIARTLAAWDAAEAERTAERVKRASDDRERKGIYHGGTVPYGFQVKDHRLVPNPPEVARIQEAVDRLLSGDTLSGIVKDWQRQGITTRSGKLWRVTGLRPILRNPAILGKNKFGEVKWEPVMDAEKFERLDKLFTDPSRWTTISPGVKGGRYSLGGGLVVCGECGHTLTSYKREKARGSRPGLRCARHTGGCGAISIDYTRLETYVFAYIDEVLKNSSRWSQRQAERGSDVDDELNRLDAEKSTLIAKRARVVDMRADGDIDKADARGRLAKIDAEVTEIDRRSSSLLGTTMFDQAVSDGLDMTDWTAERKRNFARLLVERIEVSRWPDDVPKGLPKRRTETTADHRERFEIGQLEALVKRVKIVPKE